MGESTLDDLHRHGRHDLHGEGEQDAPGKESESGGGRCNGYGDYMCLLNMSTSHRAINRSTRRR